MTAIKTEEERARLDELYALVEAEMDQNNKRWLELSKRYKEAKE